MLEIRVLSVDEWTVWRELRLAALGEAPYAFGSTLAEWQGDGDREERWRARLAIPGTHLVAYVDGVPVGMASGVPAEDGAELISMWVSPAARGHGVGDRLIAEVEAWAVREGASTLALAVVPGNVAAIKLYERNGLKDTGERGDPTSDGSDWERVMAKPLSARN